MTKSDLAYINFSHQLALAEMGDDIREKISRGESYTLLFKRYKEIKQLQKIFDAEYGKSKSDLERLQLIINTNSSLLKEYILKGDVELNDFRVIPQINTFVRLLVLYGGGGGGGGGTPGIVFRLRSISPVNSNFIKDSDAILEYNFTSIDSLTSEPTGNGNVEVTVNGVVKYLSSVPQGNNSVNVKNFLRAGANEVTIRVTDSYSNTRLIQYNINLVELSISTTYDITTINTGEIIFRYTPIGTFEKTVHFLLDGVEIATEVTTANNTQLTKYIPPQSHGVHRLEVYMTANLNGVETRSNTLLIDIISVEEGNNTPIIAVDLIQSSIEQFLTVPIPFFVYTPLNLISSVDLKVNGVTVSTLNVPRTKQIWNYKSTTVGALTLSITSGAITNSFTLNVTPSSVNVLPVTNDLELFLTSQNRSNQEVNRNEWKFGTIHSTLTGFNWFTNGWLVDNKGNTALKVNDGASITIPFKPFQNEIKNSGKTLEFEFSISDVKDYTATIITCLNGTIGFEITSTYVKFGSEQVFLETPFKEDERVRVSLIINKLNDNRLIYIYINGIISAVIQYPGLDNFIQAVPQNITIGNNQATINIYNIRSYSNNLTNSQVLSNYIADLDDIDSKLALIERNNVFNDFGLVDLNKALELLPCLIITGRLPDFKGDKVMCDQEYIDLQNPSRSFTARGQVDVQGTSSQYYPRKNYKIKYDNFTNNGVTTAKYQLRPGYIGERTFTFKADFAESSGTHNTGFARLIHYLSHQLNILTPAEIADSRVRTTIDGFPMLIFHKANPNAPAVFVGKYNFNHDKGNTDTFGFKPGDECWEVLNNTSDNVLFKSSDFTSLDEEGEPMWLTDFEGRYPEDNTNPSKLQPLHEWISSTNGDVAKFKSEVANHFNLDNLLFYYCMTEFAAAVDQRAKNSMLTYFADTDKWYYIFYDNDTILGLNNEGANSFDYTVEYHDTKGSGNVWNAESSVLFNNIEQAFPAEIAAMYARIRGEMTYEVLLQFFNVDQSNKWGEAIYNEDTRFKYIEPLLQEGQGTYLYAAQGSRTEHRKWWLFNRLYYLDGKYNTATFLNDYVTMRLYTPSVWTAIAPNANFSLFAFKKGYVRTRYGSVDVRAKAQANNTVLITAPSITFNDTETIIYGMSNIRSLGSLAAKYAGTIDLSKALKLVDLQIGSSVVGYKNRNLISLSLGNNKLLQTIDISNCEPLTQPLDLSGCPAIKEVKAFGSGISSVILAEGGVLTLLQLPAVSSLVIKGQLFLTAANVQIQSTNLLKTVIIENCPLLNLGDLVDTFINAERVRFVGITGSSEYSLDFYYFNNMKGLDENGNTTPNAVIEGTWHFENAFQEDLDQFAVIYPMLNVTYGNLLTEVPFKDAAIKNKLETEFGTLTLANIRSITSLDGVFEGFRLANLPRTTFDELRYFTGVTKLGLDSIPLTNDFGDGLDSISLPKTVVELDQSRINARIVRNFEQLQILGAYSFGYYWSSQCFLNIPYAKFSDVHTIKREDVNGSSFANIIASNTHFDFGDSTFQLIPVDGFRNMEVKELTLPNTLKKIDTNGLNNLVIADITKLHLPNSLEEIGSTGIGFPDATHENEEFLMPLNLRYVGDWGLISFRVRRVIFQENIQELGHLALASASDIYDIVFLGAIPPAINANSFSSTLENMSRKRYIYVPDEAINTYKEATNWTVYADEIFPLSTMPPVGTV